MLLLFLLVLFDILVSVAKAKKSVLDRAFSRIPPWYSREGEDKNPSDDLTRSFAGKKGWLHPRQVKDPERLFEMSRTRRPLSLGRRGR